MGFKGPHRIDKGHLSSQGSHVALPGYAVEYRAREYLQGLSNTQNKIRARLGRFHPHFVHLGPV